MLAAVTGQRQVEANRQLVNQGRLYSVLSCILKVLLSLAHPMIQHSVVMSSIGPIKRDMVHQLQNRLFHTSYTCCGWRQQVEVLRTGIVSELF